MQVVGEAVVGGTEGNEEVRIGARSVRTPLIKASIDHTRIELVPTYSQGERESVTPRGHAGVFPHVARNIHFLASNQEIAPKIILRNNTKFTRINTLRQTLNQSNTGSNK